MRKITIFMCVICVFIFPQYVVSGAGTNQLYNQAINSIEAWLNSVPENQYQEATNDEIFKWKVELEKSGGVTWNAKESFQILQKLFNEIGNKQFVYDNVIINKSSLKYFEIQNYVQFYNKGFDSLPNPSNFFVDVLAYYKKNISNKNEQWEWLYGIMQMLSYQEYYTSATLGPGYNNENYINSLKDNYESVILIVKQYLAVGDNLLLNNSNPILKSGRLYFDYSAKTYMNGLEVSVFLGQLYNFVYHWKDELVDNDKTLILNFILPKYKNNDYAVKIYSLLSE